MRFKRAVQRYGRTPVPETPYQRAGRLWDERIGSARAQAHNWRLMAFGGLFLTTGLAAALVWQSMQSRVVPYVVEVDRLGRPQALALAAADYRPSDPQIAWFLSRFIADVRGRSLDPVLMRANWLEAYDFASKRGALFLNDHARASAPFADIGDRTVSVQVISVVRASERSFQVEWTERAFERGIPTEASRWTAILSVIVKPPGNTEVLRKNPLGLYVDAIDWSRQLDADGSASPSSRPAAAFAPARTDLPQGSPLDPGVAEPVQQPLENRP